MTFNVRYLALAFVFVYLSSSLLGARLALLLILVVLAFCSVVQPTKKSMFLSHVPDVVMEK